MGRVIHSSLVPQLLLLGRGEGGEWKAHWGKRILRFRNPKKREESLADKDQEGTTCSWKENCDSVQMDGKRMPMERLQCVVN